MKARITNSSFRLRRLRFETIMNAGYRDILKILGTYGKAKQSDCMAQREQFQTNCRNLSWKSVLMEQVGDKKRFRTNRNKM